MRISDAAKNVDEAVRFQIYRNGEDQVFAKGTRSDRSVAEQDATVFVDDETVFINENVPLPAGSVDKYTVVIWVEGNDPDCLDPIRGGSVRSNLVFDVVPDKKD